MCNQLNKEKKLKKFNKKKYSLEHLNIKVFFYLVFVYLMLLNLFKKLQKKLIIHLELLIAIIHFVFFFSNFKNRFIEKKCV